MSWEMERDPTGQVVRVKIHTEDWLCPACGQTFPADMLWARCVTRYARRADAGATLGIYSPADWDGHDTMTLSPEEYAAVTVPEPVEAAPALGAGELPLQPGDEAQPIMVSCPRCSVKVPTGELAEHLGIEHEGEK